MKKTLYLTLILILTLIISTTAYALNCGGGYFNYGADYGTSFPWDDARGYTTTYGYSHSGTYNNYLYAYVKLTNSGYVVSGTMSLCDTSSVGTGWITLSGFDHATVYHSGTARCDYPNCSGNNTLSISENI